VEASEVADAVGRAAAGDKAAWNSIVESFSKLVWSVANAHRLGPADAAEVTQTTWVRLIEHIDRITNPERLGGWLATTARRESLRILRLRGRETLTDSELAGSDLELFPAPETAVLERDRNRQLWAAFGKLSERCQAILQLVVVVAPPYVEVANALGMPIGSIGPSRARCLQQLRRLLGEE
jgi:RNA polymerase sigma factor (sigma-70 family)